MKRCEVIAFHGFTMLLRVWRCIVLDNDKGGSRGIYIGIEGRGERGIWAFVFEEFIL